MTLQTMGQTLKDLGIDPKTFTRDEICAQHGPFTEVGGSLTGREDRIRWFGCPDCNKVLRDAEEAAQRAREEQARQERIERRLQQSGIPLAFRGRSFDNYEVGSDKQGHVVEIAKSYADAFWHEHAKTGGSLVFGGASGTGKSHLALAIAQQVLKRGTAMYLNAADLMRKVRATWSRQSELSEADVLNELAQLDLLVLDEVGTQRGTDDEQLILFDVLNRRYADLRPVILLTNLSGQALAEVMGPRLIDRLKERATFVAFTWDSYRTRR